MKRVTAHCRDPQCGWTTSGPMSEVDTLAGQHSNNYGHPVEYALAAPTKPEHTQEGTNQ